MMSSILKKTFKQTMSIVQVPGSESVSRDLQSLEKTIMGLNRSMDKKEIKNKVEESQAILTEKCQDLKLSKSDKRICIQIINHLGNLDEKLPSVYPFIVKFIEDSSDSHDKLLGHIALRIANRNKSPDIYIAINTLQKDLSSKNPAVVLVALTTLASIIDLDMVPVFHPYIDKLFKSNIPDVRCKALYVVEVMHSVGPEYLPNIWNTSLHALCDRDPHVMSASLPLLQNLLLKRKPPEDSNICQKLVYILKQILHGRLPLDMMYAGICAPWDLIRILKMLRILPKAYFSEQDFDDITQVIEQLLTRIQASNVIHVAIASECIHVIVHFHSNLNNNLHKSAIHVLDSELSSENPNIAHSAIQMLTCVKQVKPGVSKLFKGCLLQLLSDSNPSSFIVIIELVDDLVSPDETKELVMELLKKLETLDCVHFKKQIILSILRIFKDTDGFNEDPNWLIKNYINLLQHIETDVDFVLIEKIIDCIKISPLEARKKEFAEIINTMNQKVATPIQYCAMFEVVLSCHEDVEKVHCENMIVAILNVMPRMVSLFYSENVLLYSSKTIMEIAGYHKISVDLTKFLTNCNGKLSMMLEMMILETNLLLSDQNLLEMFIAQTGNKLNIDDTATSNATDKTFETDSPKSISVLSGSTMKSAFKTQRYSQSRFTSDDAVVTPEKQKETFLAKQMTNMSVARSGFWDCSNYKSSHSDNAESGQQE